MNVVFWAAGDDGSSYYRCTLPAEAMQWEGHQTKVTEVLTPAMCEWADAIVGSRIANPNALGLWKRIKEVRTEGTPKLILDLDDAYFSLTEQNPAAGAWNSAQLDRLAEAIHTSDAVTVASQALAEHVLQKVHSASSLVPVHTIENGLHAGWLAAPREYVEPSLERPLTVGWSGTASSAVDFDIVARALGRIVDYGQGTVQVRLVGLPLNHPAINTIAQHVPDHLKDMVQGLEWVHHGEPYLSTVHQFDVWVAPYRSNEFVDAKFPTKALEAGMLGIPLIASAVRPYREWIEHESTGFKVVENAPWMWSRCLKRLVDDPALRQRIGEAARSRAAQNIMQSLGQSWSGVCKVDT